MPIFTRLFCLLLLSFLGLSACAIHRGTDSRALHLSWAQRQQQLNHIHSWKLKGAVAIHTQTEHVSASLSWRQIDQNYNIALYGPLGMGAVQVSGGPNQVKLQLADGKIFYARSPEELLRKQVGWDLPISYLHYWIRGLPVPGISTQRTMDSANRLAELHQGNWRVSFKHYSVFNHSELPTKLVLLHPQLHIKIVIDQWGV